MNLKYTLGFLAALAGSSITTNAQSIDFENGGYASLGVYDTWESSPFRTGALNGNIKVVDNHLADPSTNNSSKILGIQRSVYGSNTFGARINLNEPLETTPTLKYVHVLMHKPVEGRVMLIGLGKRTDRPEQSAEVEQFWSYPTYTVPAGEWADAVFPVKTNGGVEIHSLVVVPHCEAPHTIDGDFVAYIDDIVVNDNSRPRIGSDKYPINYDKSTMLGRSDRYVTSLTFTSSSDGAQQVNITNPSNLYKEAFDVPVKAKAGATVNTAVAYAGFWMHSYLYLDKENDGDFSYGISDNITLDPNTDLISFSLYTDGSSTTGKNSSGQSISSSNNGFDNRWTPPAFTVPTGLPNGIYRMRYKLDWNNIDAGGDVKSFISNGGTIIDMLLNVHGDDVTVRQDNRNGEITLEDGTLINALTVPFGEPLTIKMNPAPGFTYLGVRIRHGYNLTGDSLINGNPQYRDDVIGYENFDSEDTYTIPGELIDGDVLIEGLFAENGTRPEMHTITYNIMYDGKKIDTQKFTAKQGDSYPEPNAIETEVSPEFYTIEGVPEDNVGDSDETIDITIENNFPFEVSRGFNDDVHWYNLSITANRNYLSHSASSSYIGIGTTTTTTPAASDHSAQWAFVGNLFDGFKIINRLVGEGYILSSSTNTSSNTGGSTYPIMTAEPVPASNNTHWIPTASNVLTGHNGFFLHQLGLPNNRMNSRDSRLAFWTGGADAGSTFLATHVESLSGIENVTIDFNAPMDYYNLQGIKVPAENLTPGIYIVRQGSASAKVMIR